jgi:NAD(P)-dependent dehydrogenase (short-subunit alcohol dehydrogenase family)
LDGSTSRSLREHGKALPEAPVRGSRLKGKTAFITGATSGIGRAAAELFAAEGAQVVVASRRKAEGEGIAHAIGDSAIFLALDVTDYDSVETAVRRGVQHFGQLDILYNNAGGSNPADTTIEDIPWDVLRYTIELNLIGTMACCRIAVPFIRAAGGGAIVNTTTINAIRGISADAYSAAKGGVISLTRSLSKALAPSSIRVNAVAPAVTGSERIVEVLKNNPVAEQILLQQPLGLIAPEDIANCALFLASAESRMITGQTLFIGGGA